MCQKRLPPKTALSCQMVHTRPIWFGMRLWFTLSGGFPLMMFHGQTTKLPRVEDPTRLSNGSTWFPPLFGRNAGTLFNPLTFHFSKQAVKLVEVQLWFSTAAILLQICWELCCWAALLWPVDFQGMQQRDARFCHCTLAPSLPFHQICKKLLTVFNPVVLSFQPGAESYSKIPI